MEARLYPEIDAPVPNAKEVVRELSGCLGRVGPMEVELATEEVDVLRIETKIGCVSL